MDATSLPKPGLGLACGHSIAPTPRPLGRAAAQAHCCHVGGGESCLGDQGYCLAAGGGDSCPACAGVTSLILLERLLIYAEELGPLARPCSFICNIAAKFVYKGFGTAADSFSPSPPFLLISCSFLSPLAPTEKLIDLSEPWLTHEPCKILSAPSAPCLFGNPAACSSPNGWPQANEFAAFWEPLCF